MNYRIYVEHFSGYTPAAGIYGATEEESIAGKSGAHLEHWNCSTVMAARLRAEKLRVKYPGAIIVDKT